jgi:hypothetical protein
MDAGHGLRLAEKALASHPVEAAAQHLDGDRPFQHGVHRLEHTAEPAGAQHPDSTITASGDFLDSR